MIIALPFFPHIALISCTGNLLFQQKQWSPFCSHHYAKGLWRVYFSVMPLIVLLKLQSLGKAQDLGMGVQCTRPSLYSQFTQLHSAFNHIPIAWASSISSAGLLTRIPPSTEGRFLRRPSVSAAAGDSSGAEVPLNKTREGVPYHSQAQRQGTQRSPTAH